MPIEPQNKDQEPPVTGVELISNKNTVIGNLVLSKDVPFIIDKITLKDKDVQKAIEKGTIKIRPFFFDKKTDIC